MFRQNNKYQTVKKAEIKSCQKNSVSQQEKFIKLIEKYVPYKKAQKDFIQQGCQNQEFSKILSEVINRYHFSLTFRKRMNLACDLLQFSEREGIDALGKLSDELMEKSGSSFSITETQELTAKDIMHVLSKYNDPAASEIVQALSYWIKSQLFISRNESIGSEDLETPFKLKSL